MNSQYHVNFPNGQKMIFDSTGRLTGLVNSQGQFQLEASDAQWVVKTAGRKLATFKLDSSGKLREIQGHLRAQFL